MSATPTRATPTRAPTVRGPSDNHPAVQLDRVQRLIAGTFAERGVLVLAFAALLLRIATLTWGAGVGEYDGFYHPDESKAWRSVQDFPGNYLSNSNYLYGTAVQYVVGLILWPVKLRWQAGHPLFPSLEYAEFVVLAVRTVHALLGSLTVVVVFWLGKIVFDRTVGLIAALLLAVSFHHVLNSAFATLDVPMSFLATLVLVLAARAVAAHRWRDFLFLGVAAGALLGTKLNGAMIVVPLAVLLALSLAARPEAAEGAEPAEGPGVPSRRRLAGGALVTGAVALAVFAISTPHVLLDVRAYLDTMASAESAWVRNAANDPLSVIGARAFAMAVSMTPPVAVLSLIGLVAASFVTSGAARHIHWALLAYLAADILFWRGFVPPRFVIPTIPILCLYAALPVALLVRSAAAMPRRAGILLCALVAGYSLYQSVLGIRHRAVDSRSLAARYIAEQLPRGATVALAPATRKDPWTTHPWRYPPLPAGRYSLVEIDQSPEYIITTSYALDQVVGALRSGELGAGYVWPERLRGRWYLGLAPTPEEFRFFQSLVDGSAGYVIERWWPKTARVPLDFPAPEIRLYRRVRG